MTSPAQQDEVAANSHFGKLWHNTDFLKLWAAQSISLMGTQLTSLALPLIAALTLDPSPLQMGLLTAAAQAPFLLVSLPAGVWADRMRRRPILIATDLVSAVLLLSIPLMAATGQLQLPQLYVVIFGIGAFSVLSQIAHRSYVPSLVGHAQLVDANSKLQISYSAADSAGPGLGGLLIQLVSAPLAVLLDAVSFLVSAFLLGTIDKSEPTPLRPVQGESFVHEVSVGLRTLFGHFLLRPIVWTQTTASVCKSATVALYVLYATKELNLGPAILGFIFAIGGLCAIPGALVAQRVASRFGTGWAMLGGWTLAALAGFLVSLAAGPTMVVITVLAVARAVDGAADVIGGGASSNELDGGPPIG